MRITRRPDARPARHLVFVVVAVALVGCAAPAAQSAPDASAAPTPASPSPSTSPSMDVATATAPPELAGRWRRSYEGEPMFLTLQGNGYTVQTTGGMGAGRIDVEGDLITFSNSNRCPDGVGMYTWSIEEDGRLRFTPVGKDTCGGTRPHFLPRATWGPVDE